MSTVFLLFTVLLSSFPSLHLQAWLTEIHEYTQQDVVLMLLGNKVTRQRTGGRKKGGVEEGRQT